MFRFTTLAALLALLVTTAAMTGCDSKSGGSERKSILGPPPSDAMKASPEGKLPDPPK